MEGGWRSNDKHGPPLGAQPSHLSGMPAFPAMLGFESTVAEPCLGGNTGCTVDWSKCNGLVTVRVSKNVGFLQESLHLPVSSEWAPDGAPLAPSPRISRAGFALSD